MKEKTFVPKKEIITPLIELFQVCPCLSIHKTTTDEITTIVKNGMLKGYLIDPKCANKYSDGYINSIDMQYNSTFYKTWNDVINKSRFELLVDQVIHYMTTYGTNFSTDSYIPNTNPNEPKWNTYKVIKCCTFYELYTMCMDMICSGIALKSSTVKHLTNYIIDMYNFDSSVGLNIDNIKNREALVILCDTFNILPTDGQKLFSHIVYKATGKTMIIKNREMRNLIKSNTHKTDKLFMNLTHEQMVSLSKVFNRYKQLFLSFKTRFSKTNINKISRLSKIYHKAMPKGFWENVINMPIDEFNRVSYAFLPNASNFKLVKVMQSIRERLLVASSNGNNMFIIRNGKIFVKETINNAKNEEALNKYIGWSNIYDACKTQLINNLKSKACAVKFPEHCNLVCPTSEKNYIGDYPMGTSFDMGKDSVIGIFWKNEWGCHDFDLSFADIDGNTIAWNRFYYNNTGNVIYSGDITDAPNGANEAIYFADNSIPTGIVSVNRYYGDVGSKYRVFFGTDTEEEFKSSDMHHEYMVDPNKLKLETEIVQGEMGQQTIGLVLGGKFYFYNISCGYSRIRTAIRQVMRKKSSIYNNSSKIYNESGDELISILSRKTKSFIDLNDILLEAGFWRATDEDENVLDLTNINKNTLIKLFTN